MDRALIKSTYLIFYMLTLFLCGTIIFLIGFFPISYDKFEDAKKGNSKYIRPTELEGYEITPPLKQYNQTVFVLVDALRTDFASGTNMPFSYSTTCAHINLRVDVPTVTMPRLKSLVTGTLSNFIDILLNLGQAEQLSDSLLHRLKQRGDKIVFAGDRTWVNLFPHIFERKYPNMDSFFVQDFYEGDRNVTKILQKELQHNEWHMLILHYLGLDHIGHVEGTESLKIPNKLKEMDEVIRVIYNNQYFHNQLILLTGDHGMRNGGGHGGSTTEELNVPLLFVERNCTKMSFKNIDYHQIDLTPTLALLLGIEIPSASIGCLIPELLQRLSLEDQLYAYYYNTAHLMNRINKKLGKANVEKADYFQWFIDARTAHKEFLRLKHENIISSFEMENAKLNYIRASKTISSKLSESLVRFDYAFIAIGLSLAGIITIYLIIYIMFKDAYHLSPHYSFTLILTLLVFGAAVIISIWCYYMGYIVTNNLLLTLPIAAALQVLHGVCHFMKQLVLRVEHHRRFRLLLSMPLIMFFGFYLCSLASSSFIEEEHLTWHYLGSTMLMMLLAKRLHTNLCGVIFADSILSAIGVIWNMRNPILVVMNLIFLQNLSNLTALNKSENKLLLSVLLIFGLFLMLLCMNSFNSRSQMIAAILAAICIYCFHGLNGLVIFSKMKFSPVNVLLLNWTCIGIVFLIGCTKYSPIGFLSTNLSCLLLLSALLHKPQNVILLPAMLHTLRSSFELHNTQHLFKEQHNNMCTEYTIAQKAALTIFVSKMFYFYQGNSNSLATIDLNPGYIGQSSYNPILVSTFVTLNTYCAPILAFQYLVIEVLQMQQYNNGLKGKQQNILEKRKYFECILNVYTLCTVIPVSAYLCLLVVFRYHLFIYSVFAPKALYDCFSIFVFYLKYLSIMFYCNFLR